MQNKATEVVPAATLVLFREHGEAPAEHLFVERAKTMSFAGGAIVFPGGRVEDDDRLLAAKWPMLAPEDAAARVAAIRETIEETGIAVGVQSLAPDDLRQLRQGLAAGEPFSALLTAAKSHLDLDQLIPFAHWRPDWPGHRVFDTRFYVAAAPDGEAQVDGGENVRLFWATAQHVLDEADAGRVQIIFPTRRNLERLASLKRLAATLDQVRNLPTPPPLITPYDEERGGERWLRILDGAGYPVTAEAYAKAKRGGP